MIHPLNLSSDISQREPLLSPWLEHSSLLPVPPSTALLDSAYFQTYTYISPIMSSSGRELMFYSREPQPQASTGHGTWQVLDKWQLPFEYTVLTVYGNTGELISYYPFPVLDFIISFKIFVNLMGIKKNLRVVFIFISLTTSKIENLFMYLGNQDLLFCTLSIYMLYLFI